MIHLPVSIGEALDKLTILDIKCRKIANHAHSKIEYDLLYEKVGHYVNQYSYPYRTLCRINEEIWDMQDVIRVRPDGELCIDILHKNDMRFRIKDMINKLAESQIREQKGYAPRRALFIGHLGLGDMIGLNGAVRYVALQHDETYVVCYRHNSATVSAMYSDMPSIHLILVDYGYTKSPTSGSPGEVIEYDPANYTNVYRSGFYILPYEEMNDLPSCFYRDMKMDPSIRHLYFHVSRSAGATDLFQKIRDQPYIFVQQKSSSNFVNLVTWDKDTILTIDPNVNVYQPDHPWYSIAEEFVNKPFIDYTEVIENATEIHTVDSAFYCLSVYLKPIAKVKRCYDRSTGAFTPQYTFS